MYGMLLPKLYLSSGWASISFALYIERVRVEGKREGEDMYIVVPCLSYLKQCIFTCSCVILLEWGVYMPTLCCFLLVSLGCDFTNGFNCLSHVRIPDKTEHIERCVSTYTYMYVLLLCHIALCTCTVLSKFVHAHALYIS